MAVLAQSKFDKLGAYYRSTKGKTGYKLPDDSVYVGDWDHFLMHGFGQRVDLKGEVYEGEFRYHKHSGMGRMIF